MQWTAWKDSRGTRDPIFDPGLPVIDDLVNDGAPSVSARFEDAMRYFCEVWRAQGLTPAPTGSPKHD